MLQVHHSYNYYPAGYAITGDLYILFYKQQDVLAEGPKYLESKSINWKYIFKILMDTVVRCANQYYILDTY